MIWRPHKGQRVQCWYAETTKGGGHPREHVRLHGKVGIVKAVGLGRRLRNVLVEIDGMGYVVPRGNLRPEGVMA